jgi:ribosomal-protein-alanine N-acetyltransferase
MTPEFLIRPMTANDVDAVTTIEQAVFSDPWPKSAFRELLKESNRINLVSVTSEGHIAGYILAQIASDEMQVQNIAVTSEFRRQQLGAALLRRAEEDGVRLGALCSVLDVRTTNEAALGLYLSFGYRMIGRRKNYYRHPVCDALVLFRRLDKAASAASVREPNDGMVP